MLLLSPTVDVEGVTVFPWELPHSDVGIGTATEADVTIHPHSHAQHCTSAMYRVKTLCTLLSTRPFPGRKRVFIDQALLVHITLQIVPTCDL